jgi:hypothetical protein
MIITDDDDGEAALAEFEKHRARFYALIGHCVTRYQSIEDYLPEVFAAALGGNAKKAAAIFAVARGLGAKLDMISAALTGTNAAIAKRWQSLLKQVAASADARNEIAHARAVHHGGMLRVTLGNESALGKVVRAEPARMELRKRKGSIETLWTLHRMIDEAERSSKLFGHLIAFKLTLEGKPVPEHLAES